LMRVLTAYQTRRYRMPEVIFLVPLRLSRKLHGLIVESETSIPWR
jgi:hypothetical protein